jgi:hypothetical protein
MDFKSVWSSCRSMQNLCNSVWIHTEYMGECKDLTFSELDAIYGTSKITTDMMECNKGATHKKGYNECNRRDGGATGEFGCNMVGLGATSDGAKIGATDGKGCNRQDQVQQVKSGAG